MGYLVPKGVVAGLCTALLAMQMLSNGETRQKTPVTFELNKARNTF